MLAPEFDEVPFVDGSERQRLCARAGARHGSFGAVLDGARVHYHRAGSRRPSSPTKGRRSISMLLGAAVFDVFTFLTITTAPRVLDREEVDEMADNALAG